MNNYSRFAFSLGLTALNVILMITAYYLKSETALILGFVGLVSAIVSMIVIKGE